MSDGAWFVTEMVLFGVWFALWSTITERNLVFQFVYETAMRATRNLEGCLGVKIRLRNVHIDRYRPPVEYGVDFRGSGEIDEVIISDALDEAERSLQDFEQNSPRMWLMVVLSGVSLLLGMEAFRATMSLDDGQPHHRTDDQEQYAVHE